MGEPFRVGIVGAGHISAFHLKALWRLPNVTVVAIADTEIDRAKKRAFEYRIPNAVRSIDELLSHPLDVVHVLTPPISHAQNTLASIDAGCHVFVEKPFVTNEADIDRIIDAAKRKRVIVGVDHSLLKDPFTCKAMTLVERGAIGNVCNVECLRNQNWPPYAGGTLPAYYADPGYPFRDLGIHAIYQIEAFLGPITAANWQMAKIGDDANLAFDDWRVNFDCQRGTAHVHLSWNNRPLQDQLIIRGSKGTLRIDRFGMNIVRTRMNRIPEHPRRFVNAFSEGLQTMSQVPLNLAKVIGGRIKRYHGLQAMVHDFYDSLTNETNPLVTPTDARRVVRWVEKIARDATDIAEASKAKFSELSDQTEILVTGGTGLIGKPLVNQLLKEGHRVRLLCRHISQPEVESGKAIEFVKGDLGDPHAVDRAMKGIRYVFHVGGVVHGEPHEFRCANVVGTQNVVDSCLNHGVVQLIYVSSLSVLHASKFQSGVTIDESWPLEPRADLRGHYTQTKLEAERLVVNAISNHDLPVVILRPAEVVDRTGMLISAGITRQIGKRRFIFGNGEIVLPLVHVDDVVDAIISAKWSGLRDGSIIHLVEPIGLTQNAMLKRFDEKAYHVPKWVLYPTAAGISLLYSIVGRTPAISRYRLRSALTVREFDCSRAAQLLGWSPRGIRSLLEKNPECQQNEAHCLRFRNGCRTCSTPLLVATLESGNEIGRIKFTVSSPVAGIPG